MSDDDSLPPTRSMIGKWSVDRYVSLIRRWSIIAALIVMVLIFAHQTRTVVVLVEVVMVGFIGWIVHQRQGGKIEGLASGAFIGVVLGTTTSVVRFAIDPTLAQGTLIIIETALSTILSAMLATATLMLLNIFHQQKN